MRTLRKTEKTINLGEGMVPVNTARAFNTEFTHRRASLAQDRDYPESSRICLPRRSPQDEDGSLRLSAVASAKVEADTMRSNPIFCSSNGWLYPARRDR